MEAFIVVGIIVGIIILWGQGTVEKHRRFCAVAHALEQDLEGLEALPREGFGRDEFKAAWFLGKWHEPRLDGFESSRLISGSFRGVPVRAAAVSAWNEEEDSDGETERHTIFNGTMVHLRGVLDRPLGRDLRVLPAGLARRAAARFGLRGKGSVDLEDPEWRRRHRVLGGQVEARVVFTPERMRAFMGIFESEPWRASVLFRERDVFVFWKGEKVTDFARPEAAVELLRRLIGLPWALGLTSRQRRRAAGSGSAWMFAPATGTPAGAGCAARGRRPPGGRREGPGARFLP